MSRESERPPSRGQRITAERVRTANACNLHAPEKTATPAHVTVGDLQSAENFRPTIAMREKLAAALDVVMSELALDGVEHCSNRAIAKRLRINEKTVRLWRLGEKTFPAHVLPLLPIAIRRRMLTHIERLAST